MADVDGPLHGVRVLDVSRVLAGPYCGMILGDLGAEVIKVERPGAGDETRAWGPPYHGELSAYYLSCNRNKKALTLDLAAAEGAEIFHELVRRSDVLLENFLPASARKLGVVAERLHAIQPRLIICSITGFGRDGPLAAAPGYDFAIQAMSGLMAITGPVEGPPCKVGVAVADVITGLYAAIGVLACLHARSQTGHGYDIDLALLDCAVAAQVNVAQAYLTSGRVPPRQGNAHLQIVPYQLFATADGHIVLAVGNDGQWQRFCRAAGRLDLAEDPRFTANPDRVRRREQLVPLLAELFRGRSTAEWQALLDAADVPNSPVLDYERLFAHPQSSARGLVVTVYDDQGRPVRLVNSPFRIHGSGPSEARMPPRLGQDTEKILRELLGFSDERIDQLKRAKTI